MKKIIVVLVVIFSGLGLLAQQDVEMKTLFGEKKGFGGYLGWNSHYTMINGQEAMLLGGELDMVIGHSFNLGFKGYGLTNSVYVKGEELDRQTLALGYGGVNLEPVLFSNSAVHITFPVLLGMGGVARSYGNFYEEEYYEDVEEFRDTDFFFVAEPGAMVELNLLKFLRAGFGASYRVTSDINMSNIDKTVLHGVNVDISLKIGFF